VTAPEPVWRPPVLAPDDYQTARSLAAAHHPFQSLIMAAMLVAPPHLSANLMRSYPGLAAILRANYATPGAYSTPAAGEA
jgi:hypothetical protein